MQLELKEITPILGVSAIIIGATTALDHLLRDRYKKRAFLFITSLAQVGHRPRSLKYYGLVTLVSLGFTLIIISVNGTLSTLGGETGSILRAFKSSGPLVLAVFFKVVVWDYLLALKSYYVFQSFQKVEIQTARTGNKYSRHITITVIVLLDLWLAGILTAGLLNWSDVFQSSHAESVGKTVPNIAKAVSEFFSEISLMATDSIEKCFYVLNGSFFMYAALGFSALASGVGKYINAKETQKNLFKILGAFAMLTLLAILVCYKLAN